jgi:hypothetical protein
MKPRIQTVVLLVVTAVGFSSAPAVRQAGLSGGAAQQTPSKRSVPLTSTPHAGGEVPSCPTGSTCG